MPTHLTLSTGADGSLAFHARDESANAPFSGMAYAKGVLSLSGTEFQANLNAKVMTGLDNQDGGDSAPQTLLGGAMDRYIIYRKRLNVHMPETGASNFGIPTLNLELHSNTTGLKVYAGISPQEDYVYPYNFNGATFKHGTESWDTFTLRYNVFDNSSGANIYTAKIGWLGGVEWIPPFFDALRCVIQTGPDGGFSGSSSWATTGQIGFQKGYKVGSTDWATGLAVYATTLSPESDTNENGETLSPTRGGGFFASQDVGPLGVGVGYAFKNQSTTGEGVDIESKTSGLNIGSRWRFSDQTILSGAFSYLGFNEETKAFVSGTEETGEKGVELNLSHTFLPGLVVGAGYALVLVDQKNQTDTAVHGNEQIFYGNLSWNGSWAFPRP